MIRPLCSAVVALLGLTASVLDLPAGEPSGRFSTLITSKTAETFVAVQEYLNSPSEIDQEPACRWLFQTAIDQGWESQVVDIATRYDEWAGKTPATAQMADQVRILGLAQSGQREESVQAYQMFLRKLRLRSPQLSSDFGQALALQMQLAGDRDAAAAVYEKLTGAFFLNPEIKDWVDRRTKRLALSGRPAPDVTGPTVTGPTVTGQPFDISAWKGKVILVDFWATNCRPCLEELPKLQEIFAEFHPLGFEMVGISFDEEDSALTEFLERQQLPWTIVKNDRHTPERFQVELIPCLVLIDATGTIAATDVRVQNLRGALQKLLSQK